MKIYQTEKLKQHCFDGDIIKLYEQHQIHLAHTSNLHTNIRLSRNFKHFEQHKEVSVKSMTPNTTKTCRNAWYIPAIYRN